MASNQPNDCDTRLRFPNFFRNQKENGSSVKQNSSQQRAVEGSLDLILNGDAQEPGGNCGEDEIPTQTRIEGTEWGAMKNSIYPIANDACKISSKENDHSGQSAQLDQYIENEDFRTGTCHPNR